MRPLKRVWGVKVKRYKAFKFRLYPNKEQQALLAKFFGCTRFVYNYYLSMRKDVYETDKRTLSYKEMAEDLVRLKKEKEFLKEVDSIALQQCLRHLDIAYCNFFKNAKTGYPRFKSRKRGHDSYSTVLVNNNIRLEDGCLVLPKLKKVAIRQHRQIPQDYILKSVTVSKTPTDEYYAALLYEYEADIRQVSPVRVIGLDYSMSHLFVSSEEEVQVEEEFLHHYRRAQKKLAREQRRLSHCQKGSRRYGKQKKRVASVHEKIANQRKDCLHKKSRQIANAYDVVCIEDLDMKAMSQGMHFGKSVSDNGWGMFTDYLQYKLEEQGKKLIKVDKWYPSSKTCHVCGYQKEDLKLSEREWTCPICHTRHDRDRNASINIKEEGMRMLAA